MGGKHTVMVFKYFKMFITFLFLIKDDFPFKKVFIILRRTFLMKTKY